MTDIADIANSPLGQIAEAAINTVTNPSISVLAEDLMLVHSLVSDVKAKLAGKPENLTNIFHYLLNLD